MFRFLSVANFQPFFILIVIAVIATIAFVVYYFSTKQVILRTLKKASSSTISRIQNNEYAKIIGLAKHVKKPLMAPISGRPCIFYHVVVQKKGSKNSWHTIIDETKTQDFFIEARGEMAIIKANEPQSFKKFYLEKDHKKSSSFLNNANPKLEEFLKSRGRKSTNFLGFSKTMRYSEGIIELDEKVAVMGVAQWKTLNEPIEGFNYSKILTLSGTKKQHLLITDIKQSTIEKK